MGLAALGLVDASEAEPLAMPSLVRTDWGLPWKPGAAPVLPRGVGRMTARTPGQDHVVSGVRLARHSVRVTIQDGFARTEVEEEFHNGTARVLEGRFEFALPEGASVSRLSLLVGSTWVEAEMVERERAKRIFDRIVDDTVRPRDPALLEKNDGRLSLRVFPIPARSSRRVLFAYNEPLERVGTKLRYAYPLAAGADGPLEIERFSIDVQVRDADRAPSEVESSWDDIETTRHADVVRVRSHQTRFVPSRDFVIDYESAGQDALPVSVYRPEWGVAGRFTLVERATLRDHASYFAVRVPVGEPAKSDGAARRVIVVDKSGSQTEASLGEQRALVVELLQNAPKTRFALLACDTACVSFPARGLGEASQERIAEARRFLERLVPSGASDVAGAIGAAGRTVPQDPEQRTQIVYVGSGRSTAGSLEPPVVGERVADALRAVRANLDLRLVGSGPKSDRAALENLAAHAGASSHVLFGSEPHEQRVARVVRELGSVVLEFPHIVFDGEVADVFPRAVAHRLTGSEIFVIGRIGKELPKNVTVTGKLGNGTVRLTHALRWPRRARAQNPLLPRLWAEARIAELAGLTDEGSKREMRQISLERHVLTKHTSLIALENEAMFREHAIGRTQRHGLPRRAHRTAAPALRMGATSVSGRMPPESIQRVLRLNSGRFRACYHRGLLRRPGLQGRVVLRFLIDDEGRVREAEDGGSALDDANVVRCMIDEVRRLAFSAPERWIRVEYPWSLSPRGDTEERRPTRGPWLARRPPPQVEEPPASSEPGSDDWMDWAAIPAQTQREEISMQRGSRRRLEELVKLHVAHGRFEAARFAARRFVEIDPDYDEALGLLAKTAFLAEDRGLLLAAMAARVELAPTSFGAQKDAAQAFAWAGEQERACAHYRAAGSLTGATPAVRAAASSCEARGEPGPDRTPKQAALSVEIECASRSACAQLAIVSSLGAVYGDALGGLRVWSLDDDEYRVVALTRGSGARVRVTVNGQTRVYPIPAVGPQTIAVVRPR